MSHCRLRIAHAHCLQFKRSGMVLMSHIREASKVTVNSSYFHTAHQHYTDEAHKAVTVPSVVRNRSMAYIGHIERSVEVGQLIRRIWVNISTNRIAPFSSCSHEAFGIENLHRADKYRLFSYCYTHFLWNFTRYYFYNSQSTHWNGILKGKRYFPVYFDLSI
jgi:hypothetical protein